MAVLGLTARGDEKRYGVEDLKSGLWGSGLGELERPRTKEPREAPELCLGLLQLFLLFPGRSVGLDGRHLLHDVELLAHAIQGLY